MERRSMKRTLGGSVIFGLYAGIRAFTASGAEIGPTELAYDNEDYGIHAEAPAGTVICQPTNVTSNHGFFIPLDVPVERIDCNAEPPATRIEFYLEYNVVF